jgi:hypothetical protein
LAYKGFRKVLLSSVFSSSIHNWVTFWVNNSENFLTTP